MDSDSILIVGTGAMACLFAARLSATGIPVTMLGTWPEGLVALRQGGVHLVELDGGEYSYGVHATDNLQDCYGCRLAIVLTKSWQTWRVARQLAECLAPDGVVLTLQNGIGNREALAQTLGIERVALGITTVGATLLGPGRVRQAGEGVISLSAHPRLAPLERCLREGGFIVEVVPDADALLWGKLVINAAINPLTALMGVPNGELLSRPAAHSLMIEVAEEATAVASALGVRLPYLDPVATVEEVASRTASNRSSMLQDVQRGAPTEIDAICGAIVQAGELTGISTPINRTLWQLVKALSNQEEAGMAVQPFTFPISLPLLKSHLAENKWKPSLPFPT